MKPSFVILTILLFIHAAGCTQQNGKPSSAKKIGGGCEGCEAIMECPVPLEKLNWTDTLPDFNEPGPKMLIRGVIYKSDGKTPAKDVVMYVYHTDQTGHYTNKYNEKKWARRHGYIRGWIRTNERGQYQFYTLKPAPYPGTNIPAHIHPVIKEPGKNEYYIDEFLFDDDPFLTPSQRNRQEGRGGNGILSLTTRKGLLYGQRDIVLGLKIPDYID